MMMIMMMMMMLAHYMVCSMFSPSMPERMTDRPSPFDPLSGALLEEKSRAKRETTPTRVSSKHHQHNFGLSCDALVIH